MNILVVHQNFPGQFPHIVTALLARGDKVAAIGGVTATARPGVDLRRWKLGRGTTKGIFDPATRAEADLIRADAAARVAEQLKRDGFTPDVIIGHPGWGETIHLKLVWPEAKLILFGEYWYRGIGGDADFDREFSQPSFDRSIRISAKNATQALSYALADRIICPTQYQASTFPPLLRQQIQISHEGLDLTRAIRKVRSSIRLPDGTEVTAHTPYVSFVSRTLEPLRGFHVFMRALPRFLSELPDARAVIVGQDAAVGYGTESPDRGGWKKALLTELDGRLDLNRVHFCGRVEHGKMIEIISNASAHIYYTYPFVLSWSLIEAMACEALVIGSDTEPVRDAITHGSDGLLLPFHDWAALSDSMVEAVRHPDHFVELRACARQKALARFDQVNGTADWLAAADDLVAQVR